MNGTPGRTDNERISDHDMLIRLDEKVDGIVEMLRNRPCPGEQCKTCIDLSNNNNLAVGKLNTQIVVQWMAIGASFAFSVLLWGVSGGNINGLGTMAPAMFFSLWGGT